MGEQHLYRNTRRGMADDTRPHSEAGEVSLKCEVAWCIQQIDKSLATGKLSQKREKEAIKCKKVLENPQSSLIKLRQAMRAQCGDYRTKMREDEERSRALDHSKVKIASVPTVGTGNRFIKKSVVISDKIENTSK